MRLSVLSALSVFKLKPRIFKPKTTIFLVGRLNLESHLQLREEPRDLRPPATDE